MAYKTRAAQSLGGPDNQSTWICMDEGNEAVLQATLTTPVVVPLGIIAQASGADARGYPAPDVLAAGLAIARLEGGQVANVGAALRAADATVALGIAVMRAGVLVGGTIAFGWLSTAAFATTILGAAAALGGGAGTPQFALGTTLQMPAVAANTALVTPQGTGGVASAAYLPLQPGDIALFVQGATASAAFPALIASARIV